MTEEMYRDLAKHDDLEYLYKQYYEIDKEVEKAKGRRLLLVFAGTYLLNLIVIGFVMRPYSLSTWIVCLLICMLASAFHFGLSLSVYQWLFMKNREDNERRDRIKMRIKYAEDYRFGSVQSTSLFQ